MKNQNEFYELLVDYVKDMDNDLREAESLLKTEGTCLGRSLSLEDSNAVLDNLLSLRHSLENLIDRMKLLNN